MEKQKKNKKKDPTPLRTNCKMEVWCPKETAKHPDMTNQVLDEHASRTANHYPSG
jgi:hypothetical protein